MAYKGRGFDWRITAVMECHTVRVALRDWLAIVGVGPALLYPYIIVYPLLLYTYSSDESQRLQPNNELYFMQTINTQQVSIDRRLDSRQ